MNAPRRGIALARAAVLASSVLLMLPGAWEHSATVVEFAQLPAGLAAWQGRSLGIYRVCGPSSKLLYALPAHLAGIRVEYPASYDSDVEHRQEWMVGRLFQEQNRSRYHAIYRWSRLLPILVTVLGGCLACEWATRLFGPWPGVGSLCLWCWMPPILAHGSLATSDMPAAVALLLAARLSWAFFLGPRPRTALLAGLALGLAASTKFTLLILYPCWAALLVGRAIQVRGSGAADDPRRSESPKRLLGLGLLAFATSLVAIDALYLFRDVGFRPSDWPPGRSSLAREIGRLGEGPGTSWLLRVPLPIPLELLRGLDAQLADSERLQSAYLLGETRPGGWWYWYAAAALLKVPMPALMLFGLAMLRRPDSPGCRERRTWAALCLLVPAAEVALVIAATTGTGTNAAFRYLMPSLALLCAWAGRAWAAGPRPARWVATGLLGWLAIDAIAALPDHLGWPNEIGRAWSIRHDRPALIGDSLDWGQDLARLGAWTARHAREGSTTVCAYGLGEGEPYGLEWPGARTTSPTKEPARYLAISDHILYCAEVTNFVRIDGTPYDLGDDLRESLRRIPPWARVGRTIRIYRWDRLDEGPGVVEDLAGGLPSAAEVPTVGTRAAAVGEGASRDLGPSVHAGEHRNISPRRAREASGRPPSRPASRQPMP